MRGTERVEYVYDYQSRRVGKKVYENNVLTSQRLYYYEGYKLIAEFDGNLNLVRSYVWAHQDVSGSADVPLMLFDASRRQCYYYVADGNKNIRQLKDQNGNVVAEYDYDPFGRVISATGTLSDANPFRFSSEYHDDETGLVYYNYRYYSPSLGRWLSRDPIEENGGLNLYGMVDNNSINRWDYLGLEGSDVEPDKRRTHRVPLSAMADEYAKQFFLWWLEGTGKTRTLNDNYWGDFMKDNKKLPPQLVKKLDSVARTLIRQGIVGPRTATVTFHAEIENSTLTGYGHLHGTNRDVGDFEIFLTMNLEKRGSMTVVSFSNEYHWNDIIDPNYDYDEDKFWDEELSKYFNPKNYIVEIIWSANAKVCYINNSGMRLKGDGYPFTRLFIGRGGM